MSFKLIGLIVLVLILSQFQVFGIVSNKITQDTISIGVKSEHIVTQIWSDKDTSFSYERFNITTLLKESNLRFVFYTNDTIYLASNIIIGKKDGMNVTFHQRQFISKDFYEFKSEGVLRKSLRNSLNKDCILSIGSNYVDLPNYVYATFDTDTLLYTTCDVSSPIFLEYASTSTDNLGIFKSEVGNRINLILECLKELSNTNSLDLVKAKCLIVATIHPSIYSINGWFLEAPYVSYDLNNFTITRYKFVGSFMESIPFHNYSTDYYNDYTDFGTHKN